MDRPDDVIRPDHSAGWPKGAVSRSTRPQDQNDSSVFRFRIREREGREGREEEEEEERRRRRRDESQSMETKEKPPKMGNTKRMEWKQGRTQLRERERKIQFKSTVTGSDPTCWVGRSQ